MYFKMIQTSFRTFLLFIIINSTLAIKEPYFWRRFLGGIPADAVTTGVGADGRNEYVGRAYLGLRGIVPMVIRPGDTVFYPSWSDFPTVTSANLTEILCGRQRAFKWVSATNTNLHLQLIGKKVVVAGYEPDVFQGYSGYTYIGRVKKGSYTISGKSVAFVIGNALLYYFENNQLQSATDYEVLTYDETNLTPELYCACDF